MLFRLDDALPRVQIDEEMAAPRWALLQRQLMETLNAAAPEFVADRPGVTANVRLPGEEAREVPALDLSSR